MWVLGNLAGEGATARDAVLGNGALPPLVSVSRVGWWLWWLYRSVCLASLTTPRPWTCDAPNVARHADCNLPPDVPPTTRDPVAFCSPSSQCLSRPTCSLSMLRIGSWTLSNLCDGQPRPVVDIHVILPVLAKLLQNSDAEVRVAVWFSRPSRTRIDAQPSSLLLTSPTPRF